MNILITGASSGIGKEMSKILAPRANKIVIVARNEQRLNELKDELLEINDKLEVKVVIKDVSIKENCIDLFNDNKDIDLLINNAGFGDLGEFTVTSLEKEELMINTNVVAYHILTKLYLQEMEKKNEGHILNVASIAGFMPGPLMATYYATKSYVVRLSEAIRIELKKKKSKVKISILCPGPVSTGFEKAANISFNFHGTDCHYVANYAIKHLNRFYIIPRFLVKVGRFFIKLLPSMWVGKMIYHFQSGRNK